MVKFVPYDYQRPCLHKLNKAVEDGRERALGVAATGLGKTAIAAFHVRKFTKGIPQKVLYLCHQTEILEQAQLTFADILGADWTYGFLNSAKKDFEVDVLFATLQTMKNFKEQFGPEYFTYVVVDESHHSKAETYLPTINFFHPKFMLAITGTPDREDLLDIREEFGKEVFNLPLERALARGYLTPVDYRIMTDRVSDLSLLDVPPGKLNIAQLDKKLFVPRRNEEIAKIILEKMDEVESPKVIIFCRNISHIEQFAALIPGALTYHSRLSSDVQKRTLELFRTMKSGIILTVGKFNEGVDVPEANIIVFLRATKSRPVFFQQLGRGLRRVAGKTRVIVLDFVGNIRRLELLRRLMNKVEFERQMFISGGGKTDSYTITLGGTFKFDEEAIDILDHIERSRIGYTKAYLIEQLQILSRHLTKTPSGTDIEKAAREGSFPSKDAFRAHFGSIRAAQLASGLKPHVNPDVDLVAKRYTDKQLLDVLVEWYEQYGQSPTMKDILNLSKKGRSPHPHTYWSRFGSFNNALKEANLPINFLSEVKGREQLLEELKQLSIELRRMPKHRDLVRGAQQKRYSSPSSYIRVFGSVKNALKELGYEPEDKQTQPYTDEELLEILRRVSASLGKVPTAKELDNFANEDKSIPTRDTISRRFGGYNAALISAGLQPNRSFKHRSREQMVNELIVVYRTYGKVPTDSIVKKAYAEGLCASVQTYRDNFGSIENAVKEAGIKDLNQT